MIYLDHAATSPLRDEVLSLLEKALREYWGNPSSLHRIGLNADAALRRAREQVAAALGCHPAEIIFTSGGTESNNTAIKGLARERRQQGRHLITTQVEHASVLEAFRDLEREGFEVTYLPVGQDGRVAPEALAGALRDDTVLVSVQLVNNEVGALQPLEEIARVLAAVRRKPRLHVDAVQALGRVPVSLGAWGVDAASFSAHKLGGPKGVGILYLRRGVNIPPLLNGGGQEGGFRSGTENVPGIVAAARAVELAVEELEQQSTRMRTLRDRFLAGAKDMVPNLEILGPRDDAQRAPHILAVSVPGLRGEVLLHALEGRGVYVSTGSACSSRKGQGSAVLRAMGLPAATREGMIRLSLGPGHGEEEMDQAARALGEAVEELASFVQPPVR